MSRALFVLFFQLLLAPGLGAQVAYQHFTPENGIPSSQVYDILQDSRGYMWFTTDRGVCRYDGYTFKTFTSGDGLPDNVVFRVAEDARSRMWFYCMNGSLCYYENGKIVPHPANAAIKKRVYKTYINSFYVDDAGQVWFTLVADTRIFRVGADTTITEYPMVHGDKNGYNFFIREIGKKGLLFSNFQLPGYKQGNKQIRFEAGTWFLPPQAGMFPPKNEGLRLFNGSILASRNDRLIHFLDTTVLHDLALQGANIQDIYQDPDNTIWLSTDKGLFHFPEGILEGEVQEYFKGKSVTRIFRDNEGGYWVATLEDGVYYIPSFHITNINKTNGLIDEKITAITTGHNEIWFGTFGGNIYRISGKRQLEAVMYPNRSYVHDIIYTADGSLLLSNSTRIKDGVFSIFEHHTMNLKLFFQPNDNELLFGGMGFSRLKGNNWEFISKDSAHFTLQTTAIFQDRAGTVWIGTYEGLYRFSNGKLTYPGRENALLRTRVSDIRESATGELYISTIGAGILVKGPRSLTQITVKQGLSSDLVEKLLFDHQGNLWAATYKGLNRIHFAAGDPYKPEKIENFTVSDGLPANEILELCLAGKHLWVGSPKGIFYFDPAALKKNQSPPPVYINSVKINNRDTLLAGHYTLTYSQRNVRIYFTGISFRSQGNVLYRYKLLGSPDTSWKHTYDRSVQYTNLEAGHYTFLLAAKNESGIWSLTPAQLSFYKAPHYTQTWWFISLVALLILSMIGLAVFIYIRNQKKKHEFDMKIARSEVKALLAQMNPHFLFNALNSVLYFIAENERRTAIRYLTKFSTLIRRILDGSTRNLVSLEEELTAITLYLDLEKLRFGDRFDFEISVDPNINPAEVQIPSMLIQPFLENAVLHGLTPQNGNGRLEVRFTLALSRKLVCMIEDNGVGLERSRELNAGRKNHKSTGLQNVQERIHLLNQLYKQDIRLEITDLASPGNQTTGTRVLLILPQ